MNVVSEKFIPGYSLHIIVGQRPLTLIGLIPGIVASANTLLIEGLPLMTVLGTSRFS
jgi:hypothetical protein